MQQVLGLLLLVVVSVSGLATSGLTSVTPTAPINAERAHVKATHPSTLQEAAGGFALIQEMMHSLNGQLDKFVEKEYSLADVSERTSRARTLVAEAHLNSGVDFDGAAPNNADGAHITPLTGGVGAGLSVESEQPALSSAHARSLAESRSLPTSNTHEVDEAHQIEGNALSNEQTDEETDETIPAEEEAHRSFRLTDSRDTTEEASFVETESEAENAETDTEAEAQTDAETDAEEEADSEQTEEEAETEVEDTTEQAVEDSAETEAETESESDAESEVATEVESESEVSGLTEEASDATIEEESSDMEETSDSEADNADADAEAESEGEAAFVETNADAETDTETEAETETETETDSESESEQSSILPALPQSLKVKVVPLKTDPFVKKVLSTPYLKPEEMLNKDTINDEDLASHHSADLQKAADHMLHAGSMSEDPFHLFTVHDTDSLHRAADWINPEIMERGTIHSYLTTAQNALTTSSTLQSRYTESLNQLMTQIRSYKPNVVEWVAAQKRHAIETIEGVKWTLHGLRPQIAQLQRMYTDALAKERYFRQQTARLQAERALQTSAPVVDAVEKSMIPNAQYEAALQQLSLKTQSAAKVRSDSEAAILAKKKALMDGHKWLETSAVTMDQWLHQQLEHLQIVLRQSRELAAKWQNLISEFHTVHEEAAHLINAYQLAIRRTDYEDQLRRLRLTWKTYASHHSHQINGLNDHNLALQFGSIHSALHDLALHQSYHGSPPAPPASWISILSVDSNPKITVPLQAPPLSIPLMNQSTQPPANVPVTPVVPIIPPFVNHPIADAAAAHHVNGQHIDSHMPPAIPSTPGMAVPAYVWPPHNPPSALYKMPTKGGDKEKSDGGDSDSKDGDSSSDDSSFLQNRAAVHAITAVTAPFSGMNAPPVSVSAHSANPTTHDAFFDSAPLFPLPASFAEMNAAVKNTAAATSSANAAAAAQAQQSSTDAAASANAASAEQSTEKTSFASVPSQPMSTAPAVPILPPPPSAGWSEFELDL